jgi:hypothetical protein
MKTVFWNDEEVWNHSHHYESLIEDVTAFNLKENLCSVSIKYMAKRLADTKYHKLFRIKYSIYEDEYKALVEKFNNEANKNGRIVVR